MPVETNTAAMPTSIQPVRRPQSSTAANGVARRGDSTGSPFSPQTNVSIKNSIDNMAGVLARISTNQGDAVEAMPQQLKQMIQNVMQNSFSLESTLAEGLGSTMESQRFSMEQLTTLSRMLTQLGTLAEKGQMGNLSDDLQTLLQAFKGFVTENDSALEPVLLNKAAFQLLDTKNVEDLSQALQSLLGQGLAAQTGQSLSTGSSESLGFLKQLMQYFMPTASSSTTESTRQGPMAGQGQSMAGTAQETSPSFGQPGVTAKTASGQETAGRSAAMPAAEMGVQSGAAGESAGSQLTAAQPGNHSASVPNPTGNMAQNNAGNAVQNPAADAASSQSAAETVMVKQPAEEPQLAGQTGKPAAGMPATQEEALRGSAVSEGESYLSAKTDGGRMASENTGMSKGTSAESASAGNMAGEARTTAAQTASLPLQNTSQTMETMKSLASLLLRDAALSDSDTALLQNFVNGDQTVLEEKDAKQLQLLLKVCERNMPAAVQQAAARQDMPEMPKLWAFMQLCDLTALKEMKARELKSAGKHLSEFVTAMKDSMTGDNHTTVDGQRSMNFMMPLYLGENEKSFPAYIHVYNEEKQTEGQEEPQKETWLRLCLLTENIGAVELTCRVYEKQKLNVRLFFSDRASVQDFQQYVPEFKASFDESPLELTDLKVGAIGATAE